MALQSYWSVSIIYECVCCILCLFYLMAVCVIASLVPRQGLACAASPSCLVTRTAAWRECTGGCARLPAPSTTSGGAVPGNSSVSTAILWQCSSDTLWCVLFPFIKGKGQDSAAKVWYKILSIDPLHLYFPVTFTFLSFCKLLSII